MSFVQTWLHEQARTSPDDLCITMEDYTCTFSQLANEVNLLAQSFLVKGWQEKTVATWLPDSLDMVLALWAIPRSGGVLLPLHARLKPNEVAAYMSLAGCSRLLTAQSRIDELRTHLPEGAEVMLADAGEKIETSKIPIVVPRKKHQLHSILLTSGTAGRPKGVQLTYDNHQANMDGWIAYLGLTRRSRYLCTLPLSHVAGMGIFLRGARAGFAVNFMPKFDAGAVNARLDSGTVTHISLVPTQLISLLRQRAERPFHKAVEGIILGGGPVPQNLIDQALALKAPLIVTYGMTETASGVTAVRVDKHPDKQGTVGRVIGAGKIMITADDGTELKAGVIGQVRIQSAAVMTGYLGRPATVDSTITTDDRGWRDEDGFLYLAAAQENTIITGGENVDPLEVETVLSNIPGVAEAGVIGIPDSDLGQRVIAVVVLDEKSLAVEELLRRCRQKLASYKVPKSIEIWEQLPRSHSGKLKRGELAQTLTNTDIQADKSSAR